MSLSLLQNATACAVGLSVPFAGTGGVAPYTYQVLPGGIGGSIDSSGLYTAPENITGTDTVEVTDDDGATATGDILVGSALELVCDIIQKEMNLDQGRVYLWDQKINSPTDSGLFIALSTISCKPFGNTLRYGSSSGVNEQQSVNMSAIITADITSRGPSARNRKEEVLLALNSTYAQQQMELNSFNIGMLSNQFINLSQIDGAAIPYRFQISFVIQYFVRKTKAVSYFDTFENPSVITN